MLIDKINQALKEAMLARDEFAKTTLSGLKSAILYEEVAKGKRGTGLSDDEILAVIAREVKKRDDAIVIYAGAGDKEREQKEMAEREILAAYLPKPLSDDELHEIIERVIATGGFGIKDMGRVIGDVKTEVGAAADGARIAKIVKELLV
ncbi:GatB/YqeY domain-containing protein [Candidatus Saccharibacteria bacterium]|nr:GatB/YqeY domain-containing protein [Candidatus Saccharibacteria bacterium]MCL1963155.1 GatB/YqeY domain-containing protein [Candidatus Saccharibacteria bacterium]